MRIASHCTLTVIPTRTCDWICWLCPVQSYYCSTHTHSLISFFDPVFDHNRQFISLYSVSLHEIHLDLFNSFEMEFSIAHMHHFIWIHTKWTNRNDTGKILIFIDMVCNVWYRRLMSKSQITKGNSIETSATSLPLSRQLLK